jgi:hypothetical protein
MTCGECGNNPLSQRTHTVLWQNHPGLGHQACLLGLAVYNATM